MHKIPQFKYYFLCLLLLSPSLLAMDRFPVEKIEHLQGFHTEKAFAIFLVNENPCFSCSYGHISVIHSAIKKKHDSSISTSVIFMYEDSLDAYSYIKNKPIDVDEKSYCYDNALINFCRENEIFEFPYLLLVEPNGTVIDSYSAEQIQDIFMSCQADSFAFSKIEANHICNENKSILSIKSINTTVVKESNDTTLVEITPLYLKEQRVYTIEQLANRINYIDLKNGKLCKLDKLPKELETYYKSNNENIYDSKQLEIIEEAWKWVENDTMSNNKLKIHNIIGATDSTIILYVSMIKGIMVDTNNNISKPSVMLKMTKAVVTISNNLEIVSVVPVLLDESKSYGLSDYPFIWNNDTLLLFYNFTDIDNKNKAIPIAAILYKIENAYVCKDAILSSDLGINTKEDLKEIFFFVEKYKDNSIIYYNQRQNAFYIFDICNKKIKKYNLSNIIPSSYAIIGKKISKLDQIAVIVLYNKAEQCIALLGYDLENNKENIYSLVLPYPLYQLDIIDIVADKLRLLVKYGKNQRWKIEEIKLF